MLATIEIIDLLDETDELISMINHSEAMVNYLNKKEQLKKDSEAQALIRTFEQKKIDYEDIERFGRYHPDYSKILKETRLLKREIDMHDTVAAFTQAERQLQTLLEDVTEQLAHTISEDIIVEREHALFTEHKKGCSTGGGCGCSA
ncbi:cell fate (sporulation/competence/biofilm development) regulator YlbF (YheA/YmcA/DUF963 family) [Streptohalobacillus salinus]|uniref:Cell fate (Sporulation/competence/biofilm development) regulator YlbF (YheA/YmcA/DUF963 family) n=1 Tax=Streptohalobacillus salinus TaxID=621096 RepID=A0A2V3WCZ5_9BACI|nr:YlbF family regulator [Streptohalobacillus salinus]PXW92626.1 cell fate (sporulation/competence/biofilm development) regulator YlbF (YheA/YmcA/DUF963 family) [Streptohalobacillus salinus]